MLKFVDMITSQKLFLFLNGGGSPFPCVCVCVGGEGLCAQMCEVDNSFLLVPVSQYSRIILKVIISTFPLGKEGPTLLRPCLSLRVLKLFLLGEINMTTEVITLKVILIIGQTCKSQLIASTSKRKNYGQVILPSFWCP